MRRREDSTIAMGKDGYPLFWKTWPELYNEAWLVGLRKRVNEALGFDLEQEIRKLIKNVIRERVAEAKDRERQRFRAQIKRWDREAALTSALNEASRRLLTDRALAKVTARTAVRAAAPIRKVTR